MFKVGDKVVRLGNGVRAGHFGTVIPKKADRNHTWVEWDIKRSGLADIAEYEPGDIELVVYPLVKLQSNSLYV